MEQLEAELVAKAKLAGELATAYLTNDPQPNEMNDLVERWAMLTGTRITVIANDGSVIGDSHVDPTQKDNHSTRPEIIQALAEGAGSSTRYSQTLGKQLRYLAIPLRGEGEHIGFVRIALPSEEIDADIAQLQRTLTAVTFIITFIAIILAIIIASRSMRPLRELTQAVGNISEGNLENILSITQSIRSPADEIGQLTRAFNNMALQLSSQLEALEAEQSKMIAVLEMMTDGVMIVDSQGKIRLINAAAESMFGVQSSNALDQSLATVLRHHQLVDLWQHCQETREIQIATIEISTQELYLQGIATPLEQALPGNTMLLFQNLTRLRRLETVRQDFTSNISHELRTPLAALKALTDTLQESVMDDPPVAQRFLQRIDTEVDALSLIVSELLELSRIELGRVPLKMGATHPRNLIFPAVERLRLQTERAGLTVNVICPKTVPLILADTTRMEQVFVNLLHNAIKFTPPKGRIEIRAELFENKVLFAVEDTGVGIPKDDLPRIFERFYKVDRARSSGGTGLGLAIARHLVEAHGGAIWVESNEGNGSTFFFTLLTAQ